MILTTYIQPVAEPVSLTDMKLHLRIDSVAEDELIKSQMQTARDWCEKYERQAYMLRSYKLYLDKFAGGIILPMPPLVSVDSVQYVDANGTTQTLSTDYYTVDRDSFPGRIYLAYNKSWPSTRDVPKAITITYKAGYATTLIGNTSDVLTIGDAVFANTDLVRVANDLNNLPAPLAANTNYYVRDVTGVTIKLALTSGGTAIDITNVGTGTNYIAFASYGFVPERVKTAIKLLTSHLYESRIMFEVGHIVQDVPFSIKNLLMERTF